MKKDPIVHGLKYLIKHFNNWEEKCYKFVKLVMFSTLRKNRIILDSLQHPESSTGDLSQDILNTPYILVKFLSFMFLEEEDDLLNSSRISPIELEKIRTIGDKLGMGTFPVFKLFCDNFEIREE